MKKKFLNSCFTAVLLFCAALLCAFSSFAAGDDDHEHSFSSLIVSEATCTQSGEVEYSCYCGYSYTQTLPATGHTEKTISATKATCTKGGYTAGKKCTVCGEVTVKRQPTLPLGHSEKTVSGTNATCTKKGLSDGIVCSVCKAVIKEQEEIPALGHSMGAWTTKIEAGCLQNGVEERTCVRCDKSETRDIDAFGHTPSQWIEDEKASCTKDGARHKECLVCHETTETQIIKKTPHEFETTTVEPTCTEGGHTERFCKNCSFKETTQTTEALGHTEVVDSAVAPTCQSEGLTEGSHCSVCGAVLTAQEVIEKLAHCEVFTEIKEATCTDYGLTKGCVCSLCGTVIYAAEKVEPLGHDFSAWRVISASSCVKEGTKQRTCSRCGEKQTQKIEKTAHLFQVEKGKEPTCTKQGFSDFEKCSVCGLVTKEAQAIAPLGHDFGSWVVQSEATCTKNGLEKRQCRRCDFFATRDIEAKGHASTLFQTVKEATCLEDGLNQKICPDCNEVLSTQTVPALGHDFEVFTTEPTCTKGGLTEKNCKRCSFRLKENEGLPLGHKIKTIAGKKPTCTESGYTQKQICLVCSAVLLESQSIDATGHKLEELEGKKPTCLKDGLSDGEICSVCGFETVEQKPIKALGHDMGEFKIGRNPTCLENGLEISTCSRCEKTLTRDIGAFGHSQSQWLTVLEPSCEQSGLKHTVCLVCGVVVLQEEIKALGHDFESRVTKPTCEKEGHTLLSCKRCSAFEKTGITPPTGHKEVLLSAVESTCTKEGLTQGSVCSLCGKVIVVQKTTEKKPHKAVSLTSKEATCTESGYAGGEKCELCGLILKQHSVVPALGHGFLNWETETQPTCTKKGTKLRKCSRCEETETQKLDSLGHKAKTLSSLEPTCLNEGKTQGEICEVCGLVLKKQESVAALGHRFSDFEITKEAKCEQPGEETRKCALCGEIEKRAIPALAHIESETIVKNVADCENDGLTFTKCTLCGKVLSESAFPKKGHIYSSVKTNPTCTQSGFITYKCSACGVGYRLETQKPTGHKFSNWLFVSPLTCTSNGIQKRACSLCGLSETNEIKAIGHVFASKQTVKEPTCTAEGLKGQKCEKCGALTNEEPIEKTAHNYKTITEKASFSKDGKQYKICSVCSKKSGSKIISRISKVSVSKTTFVFNSKNQKPTVVIYDSAGKKLSGKYYSVSFPKESKNVGVYYITVTLKGLYDGKKILKIKVIPQKPGKIDVKQTSTSLTLTWNKQSGAAKYEIYLYNSKTKAYEKASVVSSNKVTLKKLCAGVTYKIKIRCVDKTGKLKSDFASVSASTLPKAPVLKAKVQKRNVLLSWSGQSSTESYTVYCKTQGGKFKKIATVKAQSFTVNNLKANSSYTFKVVANKTAEGKTLCSASNEKTVKIK